MKEYLEALNHILTNGTIKQNRTGISTVSVFGYQMRFNLRDGFPAVTTKKLAFKSMASELLWFLEGSSDERRLAAIQFGSRNSSNKTIWTENAFSPYWIDKAEYPGDCGRIYGKQMREWKTPSGQVVDQVANLIQGIKSEPTSRRHIIVNYNPGEIDQMCLPPCHAISQFDVSDGKLSCQMYQRSADAPLGTPYNIASYSLLTHMIAQVCDLEVGEFIYTVGDFHVYENQIADVRTQLSRQPFPLPKLWLNPKIKCIEAFSLNDIKLLDYEHHSQINYQFTV